MIWPKTYFFTFSFFSRGLRGALRLRVQRDQPGPDVRLQPRRGHPGLKGQLWQVFHRGLQRGGPDRPQRQLLFLQHEGACRKQVGNPTDWQQFRHATICCLFAISQSAESGKKNAEFLANLALFQLQRVEPMRVGRGLGRCWTRSLSGNPTISGGPFYLRVSLRR